MVIEIFCSKGIQGFESKKTSKIFAKNSSYNIIKEVVKDIHYVGTPFHGIFSIIDGVYFYVDFENFVEVSTKFNIEVNENSVYKVNCSIKSFKRCCSEIEDSEDFYVDSYCGINIVMIDSIEFSHIETIKTFKERHDRKS